MRPAGPRATPGDGQVGAGGVTPAAADDLAGGLAGGPAARPPERPDPDRLHRPAAPVGGLAEALIGLRQTEAEARLSALAPGAGEVGGARQRLRAAFRTAGPLRPGAVSRVVRAHWRSGDVLEVVCAGFLAGPGGRGPRDPEVTS